ncbi:MAG: hypothetical protein ACJA07_002764 [Rhodococcus sp. (in: high G+C Gram-positive bacteria)]|jgi:hypothetical protein
MKTPAPPPAFTDLLATLREDMDRFMTVMTSGEDLDGRD